MKITRQEILDLNNSLALLGNLSGVKFAYAIARNKGKLKPEIDSLKAAAKTSEGFEKYEKERVKLAEKHARKVDGKPETYTDPNDTQRFVITDQEKFDAELAELNEKNKAAIQERKEQLKEFDALLKEQVEIDLHMLYLKDIPEGITTHQMSGIYLIVAEDPKN